jgi:3-hydroxyisobutyrate dehydrogenase-like beta-hydroxyacid dehydrogenase
MNQRHIGFIGAGQIGEPMALKIAGAGGHISVYARRPDVRERLEAGGVRVVDSVDALSEVDILGSCLFSDVQLAEVLSPLVAQLRSGTVVYSHTTGSPSVLEKLSASAERHGVAVVDAPFSGQAEAVRAGQLTVMLGGDDAAVDAVADVVAPYASTVLRTGPLGSGLATKLLNNLLFAACSQLTLSALSSAAALGIEESDFLRVLQASSGGSAAAGYIAGAQVPAAEFSKGLPHYLSKDVAAATAVAKDIGLDIEALVEATRLGPMDLHPI